MYRFTIFNIRILGLLFLLVCNLTIPISTNANSFAYEKHGSLNLSASSPTLAIKWIKKVLGLVKNPDNQIGNGVEKRVRLLFGTAEEEPLKTMRHLQVELGRLVRATEGNTQKKVVDLLKDLRQTIARLEQEIH